MKEKRYFFYAVLGVCTLVLLVLLAYRRLITAHAAAIQAGNDLAQCQSLATYIEGLKQLPAKVGLRDMVRSELDHQLEAAAKEAGFTTTNIVSITPSSPRRVGNSVYQEKPTDVVLRELTLQQLLAFLYNVNSKNVGLCVQNIRLTAPRNQNATGHWTAQVTLSYLIYSPKTDSKLE